MSNREETAECVEPEQADNGNVGTPCNDDSVCTGDDALCCDISGPDDAESRVCASSNLCDICGTGDAQVDQSWLDAGKIRNVVTTERPAA